MGAGQLTFSKGVGVQWAGEDLRMSFVLLDRAQPCGPNVFRNRTNLAKPKLATSRVVIYDLALTLIGADCNWNSSCCVLEKAPHQIQLLMFHKASKTLRRRNVPSAFASFSVSLWDVLVLFKCVTFIAGDRLNGRADRGHSKWRLNTDRKYQPQSSVGGAKYQGLLLF